MMMMEKKSLEKRYDVSIRTSRHNKTRITETNSLVRYARFSTAFAMMRVTLLAKFVALRFFLCAALFFVVNFDSRANAQSVLAAVDENDVVVRSESFPREREKSIPERKTARRIRKKKLREEFKKRCEASRARLSEEEEEEGEEVRRVCLRNPTNKGKSCVVVQQSRTNKRNVKAFWGKHIGDVGVLFCTGRTLDAYGVRHPALYNSTRGKRQRVVTVGVNAAIFNEKIQPLDYLFLQDRGSKSGDTSFASNRAAMVAYKPREAKFFGFFPGQRNFSPSDKDAEQANAMQYEGWRKPHCANPLLPLVKDVGNFVFGGSCSTSFAALQFILYTGVKKLYLIGCDILGGYGHSATKKSVLRADQGKQRKMWRESFFWTSTEYPCVEIIAVRPKGLRNVGFFELFSDPPFIEV